MAPRRQKIVTVQRLMGVIDDPDAATSAIRRLAQAGFPPEAMAVLLGDQDADRIDSLGKQSGLWKKLWRAVQFTQTDQMVDLVVYEAALRDGRAVVTVHTPRAEDRQRAKRALAAAGAHFMNFFGRLSTEDISRWRGKEPPRHPNLYR
jgi:hypothetical protein